PAGARDVAVQQLPGPARPAPAVVVRRPGAGPRSVPRPDRAAGVRERTAGGVGAPAGNLVPLRGNQVPLTPWEPPLDPGGNLVAGAAGTRLPAGRSHVEADVEDVAVADDVRLPFEPLLALLRHLRVRAELDEVAPIDDLAADEATRDVGVDRLRRVEGCLAVPERPRTRLLLAGGEERDQVERLRKPRGDRVERRRAAAAELGRLLVRKLGELGLEQQVDPAGAVLDRDQRLRRQRLELRRQLARIVREHAARVDVREDPLQLVDLRTQLRITRLRLLLDPVEAPLDVVAVGDEQLEPEVLEV